MFRVATYGPCDWYDQFETWICLLTMKQTLVSGVASYARLNPTGQYVVFVRLLYAGSWIANTACVAGETASRRGLVVRWLACPQLYCIILIVLSIRVSPPGCLPLQLPS